ncbi:hypothetical protein [Pseudomonas vanderleydeniana]|uniref:Uncharacterized protein n=1 Tax=Pseudomonas vanderleydeniana TaxID=2745495 RepID=A0A9E6PHK5_9PSED|nr:hypothetical protein [Pseudomonas vanderleydeniana]QXI26365.1 hypothetical protein HU752_020750 [Pseudomonas vanderleydeniana]
MALRDYADLVTIVISPGLTIIAAIIGWAIIIKDSRSSAHRAEATELLNLVVGTTVDLNRRAANFLLDEADKRENHRAWVSSVSVDIASLRARAAILKNIYKIDIPDDFFFTLRKSFTLNAEAFHEYDSDQVSQLINIQTSQVSKTLATLYKLYPSKKTWKLFQAKTTP